MSDVHPEPDDGGPDLERQIVDLRRRVDRLTEDLDHALTLVDQSLSAVREEMHGPGAQPSPQSASSADGLPPTWCSRDHTDEQAAQLHDVLTEWVAWLRSRYPLAKDLPECWDQHPELLEETTALYAAWRGAYRDPQAPSWAFADWHDRWLPGYLARIRRWGITCTDGEHSPRGHGVYATPASDQRRSA